MQGEYEIKYQSLTFGCFWIGQNQDTLADYFWLGGWPSLACWTSTWNGTSP